MDLDSFSRFKQTPPLIADGKETYGLWQEPNFLIDKPTSGIRVLRVTGPHEGRPDLISEQVYGTPLLDWVLIAFNKVRDPLNWPRTGDVIECPPDTVVLPELL